MKIMYIEDNPVDIDLTLRKFKKKAPHIDVTTAFGVVTLGGTVEDILKKERAVKVAQTVKGVRSVIDTITVAPAKRPDSAILYDINQALAIDSVTESWEIGVTVNEGIATLTGDVDSFAEKKIAGTITRGIKGIKGVKNDINILFLGTRPDSEIQEEVTRRLKWDTLVDAVLVDVEVSNGKVILSGVVGSAAEHTRALTKSWVAGVKVVDASSLEVNWWAKDKQQQTHAVPILSDEEIEKAVKDSLLFDPRVKLFNVAVFVKNGFVTLSGVVDNLSAKRAAANDARNTLGVWSVKNHIKVRPGATPDDKTLTETINNVLTMDPVVERYEINITVDNGIVYLTGTVDSYFEKATADHIVSSITGVREVYNGLKINDHLNFIETHGCASLHKAGHFIIFSIAFNSSAENSSFLSVSTLSSICLTELAPISTEVIRLSFRTQANAICASDCPRCCAISFSLTILSWADSTSSFFRKTSRVALEPSGMPFR